MTFTHLIAWANSFSYEESTQIIKTTLRYKKSNVYTCRDLKNISKRLTGPAQEHMQQLVTMILMGVYRDDAV